MSDLHHEFGPSKWPAILDCPCFEGKGDTSNSELGTKTHEMLHRIIVEDKVPDEFLDDPVYEQWLSRAVPKIKELLSNAVPGSVVSEFTCNYGIYYGTCDIAWKDTDGFVHVADFKTFYNPGRDYTAQLAGYAICFNTDKQKYICHVVYGENGHVETTEIQKQDAWDIEKMAITRLQTPLESRGEARQCNWCDLCARGPSCAKFREVAESVVKTTSIATATEPGTWAAFAVRDKVRMLILAEAVGKWAEAVRENARADLEAGMQLSDTELGAEWKLRFTSGRATPRVSDLWRECLDRGVSADDFRSILKTSTTDAVKLLASTGMKQKDAKALVDSVSDHGPGGSMMVRCSPKA